MTEFQSFFGETDNQLRAFKSLYYDWKKKSGENFYLTSAMVVVCNEECIQFLAGEMKMNSFVEPNTWQFRNALGFGRRPDMLDSYQEELLKIDHDKYAFKQIDHKGLEISRRKRDIELLLSKKDFLNEIKRIYEEESSEPGSLSWDEVYSWKSNNFNDEKMSSHLASEILRELAHDKKFVTLKEVESLVLNEKRWKWLQIFKIVQYDKDRDDFEYTKELYQLVCNWVFHELKTANFNTAIEYREQNKYHYRYSELYVSYFIQRLNINVTNSTLLNLLTVECYLIPTKKIKSGIDNNGIRIPNTFDYVVEKLGLRKVVERVISNLKNSLLVPIVKQSHFQFCEYFQVIDAAPFILDEIISDDSDEHEKRSLITQYVNLNSNLHLLLEAFESQRIEIKLHMAEKIGGVGFKPMLPVIQKAITEESDEDKRLCFIQSIFKIDEKEGFLFLKKWIIKNKRLPVRTRSCDYFSKAKIKDLFELFEHSVDHNYGSSAWHNPNRQVFIEEMVKKGSLSEKSYFQVKNQLKEWINVYEDLKFLHYQIQHLNQLYYSQKAGTLELDEVLKLIESCSY